MNYKYIHDQIIEKAFNRSRIKENYYELHHINPKCLGGNNGKSNLVYLTAREHLIIHKLLVRIYPENYRLAYALWAMASFKNKFTGERKYISSKEYEEIKLQMSVATKKRLKENNPWLGRNHSEESKLKQSESAKIRNTTLENDNIRRQSISKTMKLVERTKGWNQNISESKKGSNNPMFGKKWKLENGKRIYYIPDHDKKIS